MRFAKQLHDTTPRQVSRDRMRRLIATRYRRGDRLPTYAEWCERLGVSLLTVQRAMGDLAREGLVYRLHGKGCYVGRSLAGGPRPLSQVGLVFSASLTMLLREPYLNQILLGVLSACESRNIDLNILSIRAASGRIPATELAAQADAVVLLSITNERYVQDFVETGVPLVLVDNHMPDLAVDAVTVDNAQALRTAVGTLLQLGHRRIAYISGRTRDPLTETWVESSDTRERRDAYLAEMAAAGLADTAVVVDSQGNDHAEIESALALVRGRAGPSAVICFSAPGATMLRARLAAAGIRVPQDVSVVGAVGAEGDGLDAAAAVACARAEFLSMGQSAIEVLERHCRSSRRPEPTVMRIPIRWTAGGSTAAPRRNAQQA
jgi:DNA-binding LacI/PurR family transcriptional regulator